MAIHRQTTKMQTRFPITATAIVLAAMLVLSTAAGVDGVVICTDDDGPPMVDERSCGCCSVSGSNDEDEPSGQIPGAPSCGDCIDVPMSVPSLESRAPVLLTSHTIADATIDAPETASGGEAGLAIVEIRPDQHWRLLAPLSTVVLLT